MIEEEKKAWEKSKEYFDDIYGNINNIFDEELAIKCTYKQAYLDGLHERQPKWHDLRKDPNDLPKENCMVLVRFENPIMKFSYFCHSEKKFSAWNKEYECNIQLHNVIAWCEIPQFNSEE